MQGKTSFAENTQICLKTEKSNNALTAINGTKQVKLANVSVGEADGDLSAAQRFMVRTVEMFVPLTGLVNVEEEIAKIEADLAYQQKFLEGVRRKLSNERFVANAPEAVVAVERKKEADSLSKIESLTAALKALKNS